MILCAAPGGIDLRQCGGRRGGVTCNVAGAAYAGSPRRAACRESPRGAHSPPHSASTRFSTAGSSSIGRLQARVVSPGHLLVASRPSLEPSPGVGLRSEEHTSELQSLMRISYAVFCLKTQITKNHTSQLIQ